MYGGFCIMPAPRGLLDPARVTMRNPTATHCRYAHIVLESANPGKRGGSHSEQGCSMDARTVGGGYGRLLVPRRVPEYHAEKAGNWPGKLFNAAARALAFFWPGV
jgi:hypothetical protein